MKLGYWKGVIVSQEIEERCATELEQLADGDYKSLDLEKLHVPGETVYSIRVNREDRLILVERDDVLIAVEYVDKHAYANCKFLKKGILRQYLLNNGANIDEVVEAGFEKADEDELKRLAARSDGKKVTWQEVERQGRRWIQLTEEQQGGLYAQAPMVVKGPAGAGKSTFALSKLLKELIDLIEDEREDAEDVLPMIYLSKSNTLVAEMQRRWLASGLKKEALDKVLFLTYDELIERFYLGPYVGPTKTLVKPDHFNWWIAMYPEKNSWGKEQEKSRGKGNRAKDLTEEHKRILWEEVQICAACATPEAYFALGERQSGIARKKEREQIYETYVRYSDYLKGSNQLSPELFIPQGVADPVCSLLIVDEAQNLSPAEVKVVMSLPQNHNTVFLAGEQQVLTSSRPNLPNIREWYHQRGVKLAEVSLPKTHRCPKCVVPLWNELMRIKRNVIGGSAVKGEQKRVETVDDAIDGKFEWLSPKQMDLNVLRPKARRTDFAVVTLERYRGEVEQLFPDGVVVFTVEEAQGLDIPELLVYNVFDEDICNTMLPHLASKGEKYNLPKEGSGNTSYSSHFDKLITTITRAERSLTIVQHAERDSAQEEVAIHLSGFGKPAGPAAAAQGGAAAAVMLPEASTDREWEVKAQEYLLSGFDSQARQIWVGMLHRPEDAFAGFKARVLAVDGKEEHDAVAKAGPVTEAATPSPAAKECKHEKSVKSEPAVAKAPAPNFAAKESKHEKPVKLESAVAKAASSPSTQRASVVSATKHVPSQFVSGVSKHETYVRNLVGILKRGESIKENLNNLVKSSNVRKFLFEIPCQDYPNLLAFILSHPECTQAFGDCLKQYPKAAANIISYVEVNQAYSGLTMFIRLGHTGLLRSLVDIPDVCHALSAEIHSKCEVQFYYSSMLIMLLFSDGCKPILAKLLDCNPQFCKIFNKDIVCTQTLFELTGSDEGLGIFQRILDNNPKLRRGMTAKCLCMVTDLDGREGHGFSPLYLLTRNGKRGLAILKVLLDNNPTLSQSIEASVLKSPMKEKQQDNETYTMKSAWDNMMASEEGQTILKRLVKPTRLYSTQPCTHLLFPVADKNALRNNVNRPWADTMTHTMV